MYMTDLYKKIKNRETITIKDLITIFHLEKRTPLEACQTRLKLCKMDNNIPNVHAIETEVTEKRGNMYSTTEMKDKVTVLSIALNPYCIKPDTIVHVQIDFDHTGKVLAYSVPDFFMNLFMGLQSRR